MPSSDQSSVDSARESGYPLLERIQIPADLRRLSTSELPQLAEELRRFLISSVSRTGGHLAAGLGVVELTIALHYVFHTPGDRLVWDVGHQAYPHKILTGRRARMSTLRRSGGLSGFLRRDESEYDAFGAGHSSTSISAALGMAVAAARRGERRRAIAVIGDGALTAGMAFEALNHAGSLDLDLLVILNDNDMSISPPVGAMSSYLARVLTSRFYTSMREGGKSVLSHLPGVREIVGRWEEHMKGMVMPGTLFEELGFNYIGPIDGHDLDMLVATLRNMKAMNGPLFLHVVTQKGKGYVPAEVDPCGYHGVTPFDPAAGKLEPTPGAPTYSQVFGDWLCDLAARDSRLVAVTPAMCEGSGMVRFAKEFPERYFDVGIAEQHALTFAAGMACEGAKPVVAIYSTFLQRAYDQLAHDISLQNLDVTLAVDRGGLVGADGPTHAGSFDLGFSRILPNMLVMAPADENECRRLLQTAYQHAGPALVRYPRGAGPGVPVDPSLQPLPVGKGELRRQGARVAILGFGSTLAAALEAGEQLDASVANMRFVKPLDRELIQVLADSHELLVSVEESAVQGGAGSAVGELLAELRHGCALVRLGLPDRYVQQGSHSEQLRECGLDAEGIMAAIRARLAGQDAVFRQG
jgi:1-deoxy-D-xylulose-5-phosphate synthase